MVPGSVRRILNLTGQKKTKKALQILLLSDYDSIVSKT